MLTKSEIADLVDIMRDVFSHIGALRAKNRLADYVQYPKITPFLSESLALHLIADGVVLQGLHELRLGGRNEADVVAQDSRGNRVKIEVKGTGSSEWVFLGDKDYSADYLLWISFGDFFENPTARSVELHLVKPSEIRQRRQRVTLQTLAQLLGEKHRAVVFDLAEYLRRK